MSRESALVAALRRIESMQPDAMDLIRKHGYVFDKRPSAKPVSDEDRWQALAFSLYSDLCQANLICRQALEAEDGE